MTSILAVHESYAQAGGEDGAFEADVAALRSRGYEVRVWNPHNSTISSWSKARQATLFFRTTWSHASYRRMRQLIHEVRPEVVHFHNTLPLISPSALRAARSTGVAVVMSLHNYRLLCPTGLFYRRGQACEDCIRSLAYGVIHGCYRGSPIQTAAVATMLKVHRALGTWRHCVDAYIVMTEFMRSKLQLAGLPEERIHVRPHLVSQQAAPRMQAPGAYAIYLGRLSEEKGIDTLIEAAAWLRMPVKIAGTGPMSQRARDSAERQPSMIHVLGEVPHQEAISLLSNAAVLVLPSRCYEAFPLVIAEAMSLGIPVIASDLGGRREAVQDGVNGFLFTVGDARSLADCANRLADDPALRARLGDAARRTFETKLSPEISYRRLMEIYAAARSSADSRREAA